MAHFRGFTGDGRWAAIPTASIFAVAPVPCVTVIVI